MYVISTVINEYGKAGTSVSLHIVDKVNLVLLSYDFKVYYSISPALQSYSSHGLDILIGLDG